MSVFSHSIDWERSFILASHVGSMARQLDDCLGYARERKQFGKSIGEFQSVSNRLADMKLRLETAQLLLYKLAWMKGQGQQAVLEAGAVGGTRNGGEQAGGSQGQETAAVHQRAPQFKRIRCRMPGLSSGRQV